MIKKDSRGEFELISLNNNKLPSISVLMSVYNGMNDLENAIHSILNQTYKDFEFIIINDGSVDNSLEIIKKYQKQDSRIVIIDQNNIGLTKSLNRGIEISRGKYIARQDADDISLDNRLYEQIQFLKLNPKYSLCGSWAYVKRQGLKYKLKKPETNEEIKYSLIFNSSILHPTFFFDKEKIKEFNISYNEKIKYAQDYMFLVDCIDNINLYNIPKPLLIYNYSENNISARKSKEQNQFANIARYKALEKMNINIEDSELYSSMFISKNEDYNTFLRIEKLLLKLRDSNEYNFPNSVISYQWYLVSSLYMYKSYKVLWKYIFSPLNIRIKYITVFMKLLLIVKSITRYKRL